MSNKADGPIKNIFAYAATIAALGASVGVPLEQALAAQVPGMHESQGRR